MPALARLQPSNCANPVLDIFTHIGGTLVDISVLEFQIFEKVTNPSVPQQVYPAIVGTRQAVDVTNLCPLGQKLTTGHYVAIWTPPISEVVGTHEIRWYFKLTPTSPEQQLREEFEVLLEVSGVTAHGYVTVSEMRDEGVPVTYSDNWLLSRISMASRMIDKFTGRFFEPRVQTLHLDGRGSRLLLLDFPIISVTSITLRSLTGESSTSVDLTDVRIYNRHLTQGLLNPDDRDNPKLELLINQDPYETDVNWVMAEWPRGSQNVEIVGTFGYTEPDGSVNGKTPDLIKHACKLLVLRYLKTLWEATGGGATPVAMGAITSESTEGQSVGYESGRAAGRNTVFTGDAEIDGILAGFVRPPTMGAV